MLREEKPGLLSIVVTNYNYGRFVGDALESVARQDYSGIELIIIDDASTDNSLQIIEGCLAQVSHLERVELIANPRSLGRLGVINQAMDHVRGEYLIVLDADDYLSEVYARRCIGELRRAHAQGNGIGMVYSDCSLVDESGRWFGTGRSAAFDAALLERQSYIPAPAVVLTRTVREVAPFDETIRKGSDHHVWQRIASAGWSGLHLAEPIFYCRIYAESQSGIGARMIAASDSGRQEEFNLADYWPSAASGPTEAIGETSL